MCPRLHHGPWFSAETQSHVSRGRMPHASLPLCACPSGRGHYLADSMHHVSSGLHGPPPFHLALPPEVARDALLATHGGLSLELCAVIHHISPMALSRMICAFGQHSLVTVLTRCG